MNDGTKISATEKKKNEDGTDFVIKFLSKAVFSLEKTLRVYYEIIVPFVFLCKCTYLYLLP